MKAIITNDGWVRIPPSVLEAAHLGAETEVEVECEDGRVLLSRASTTAQEEGIDDQQGSVADADGCGDCRLERHDGWLVAVAVDPNAPVLTQDIVNETIARLREERMDHLSGR
jgi:hypothetical protein